MSCCTLRTPEGALSHSCPSRHAAEARLGRLSGSLRGVRLGSGGRLRWRIVHSQQRACRSREQRCGDRSWEARRIGCSRSSPCASAEVNCGENQTFPLAREACACRVSVEVKKYNTSLGTFLSLRLRTTSANFSIVQSADEERDGSFST